MSLVGDRELKEMMALNDNINLGDSMSNMDIYSQAGRDGVGKDSSSKTKLPKIGKNGGAGF